MKPIVYQYKKDRLWHGCVSIRSTIVEKALEEGRPIKVVWKDKTMYLYPDELENGTTTGEVFVSKHDSTEYKLFDYKWKRQRSDYQILTLFPSP